MFWLAKVRSPAQTVAPKNKWKRENKSFLGQSECLAFFYERLYIENEKFYHSGVFRTKLEFAIVISC